MRTLINLLFTLLVISSAFSQTTYSRLFDLGLPNTIFTGIEIVDEEIFLSGVVRDTINGLRFTHGIAITDFDGNLQSSHIFRELGVQIEPWANSVRSGDLIFHTGYSHDSLMRGVLICLDVGGNHLWTVKQQSFVEPTSFFRYNDVCIINDRVFVTGHNSVPPFLDGSIIIVAEYTTEGQFVNYFTLSTAGRTDFSLAIKAIDDEQLLIATAYDNYNITQTNIHRITRLWITDLEGNIVQNWMSPADELQDGARDVMLTPDGGYVVASARGDQIQVSPTSADIYWDCMLYKLDANFNELWRTYFRHNLPTSIHRFHRLIAVADGSGYVAAGRATAFYGGDDIEQENIGDWGGIVAKVSPAGDSLWSRIIIHPDHPSFQENDIVYDIKEMPDGGFVLVGESGHYLAPPTQQGWLLRLDEYGCLVPGCHLVSDTGEPEAPLRVLPYPNPVQDVLNVFVPTGAATGLRRLQLLDGSGRVLRTVDLASTAATYLLEMTTYPAGTYYLRVLDASGRVSYREGVIKQ